MIRGAPDPDDNSLGIEPREFVFDPGIPASRAYIIPAEATVKFVLDEFDKSQSYYNIRIQEAINQRIVQDRYTETLVIAQYLHNPSDRLEKMAIVNTFILTY